MLKINKFENERANVEMNIVIALVFAVLQIKLPQIPHASDLLLTHVLMNQFNRRFSWYNVQCTENIQRTM